VIDEIFFDVEEKMFKVVEVVKEDFGVICMGCVNFVMFIKFMVDYYGILMFLM